MAFPILILVAQMNKPSGVLFLCCSFYFVNNAYNILTQFHCLKYVSLNMEGALLYNCDKSNTNKHNKLQNFELSQWSRVLLEMLTGALLVKKWFTFYDCVDKPWFVSPAS
jgi:hypothetical protein